MANLNLVGTDKPETFSGEDGNDTISGGGGADTLVGGDGDDLIDQTAPVLNAAAGSMLDGGAGNDHLIFDGSQAYTLNYVTIRGGSGADLIEVATRPGQYAGAVQVEGGTGDDTIRIGGNLQGGERGLGYLDGGEGSDVIEVLSAANGVGVWGNRAFQFRGGAGDDTFRLGGTQIAYSPATAARLDGGAGFDTLVWNGSYNLTIGGHQNAAVGLYNGRYVQEVQLANVERLDLAAAGASGLALTFTAQDVAAITAGSDFSQDTLGLGLTGTGNTLFIDPGANTVDLTGWTSIGTSEVAGVQYEILSSDKSYLAIRTATEAAARMTTQQIAGVQLERTDSDQGAPAVADLARTLALMSHDMASFAADGAASSRLFDREPLMAAPLYL